MDDVPLRQLAKIQPSWEKGQIVHRNGGYTFGDYVKVGLPLQIIKGIVMTIVLPLPFPLYGREIVFHSHGFFWALTIKKG